MSPRPCATDVGGIVNRLLEGDRRALSRAISRIEDGGDDAVEIIKAVHPRVTDAWVVGITGGTGTGKSTLVDCLIASCRARGRSVGVVAVDPSSPFSGGAVLGDRVRMQRHATDPGVFVRSMASRGALGGLGAATYDVVTLMAAAGFERLFVETVGVGQEELDVAGVAHTTCVVVTPAGGDGVQAIKAGILEVADILILNKADLPTADRAEAQLRSSIEGAPGNRETPIVPTIAVTGEGTDELIDQLDAHRQGSECSEDAALRKRMLAGLRLRAILASRLWRFASARFARPPGDDLLDQIANGDIDPYSAADQLMSELLRKGGDE